MMSLGPRVCRRRRVVPRTAAAFAAVLLASGCASDGAGAVQRRLDDKTVFPLTKEESQHLIWGIENDVVALLPEGTVLEVEQATDDNSLTCAPGAVVWTGLTIADTVAPADVDSLIEDIRARWADGTDYAVEVEEMSDGDRVITLSGARGDNYFIEAYGTTLEVRSFGPCVRRDA